MKVDAKDVTFTVASFFRKPNLTQPFVIIVSDLLHSNIDNPHVSTEFCYRNGV